MAGTRWARLTWQAGDPKALAEELARRLDVESEPVEGGAWQFGLGGEVLDVVPWRREGAGDNPTAEGRLMFEPIDGGGDPPDPDPFAPLRLVGVAWSTVELDRAEAEMEPWLLPSDAALGDGDAAEDPHLGARTRLRRSSSLPGDTLVLAEPGTEGRLAGSLARDGEGPCALYLRPAEGLDAWVAAARDRSVRVSARRLGPLGRAVLLPGRGIAGPHLLIVDAPAAATRASTIAP